MYITCCQHCAVYYNCTLHMASRDVPTTTTDDGSLHDGCCCSKYAATPDTSMACDANGMTLLTARIHSGPDTRCRSTELCHSILAIIKHCSCHYCQHIPCLPRPKYAYDVHCQQTCFGSKSHTVRHPHKRHLTLEYSIHGNNTDHLTAIYTSRVRLYHQLLPGKLQLNPA